MAGLHFLLLSMQIYIIVEHFQFDLISLNWMKLIFKWLSSIDSQIGKKKR